MALLWVLARKPTLFTKNDFLLIPERLIKLHFLTDPVHQPRQAGQQVPGAVRVRGQLRHRPEAHSSGALHPHPRPVKDRRHGRVPSGPGCQPDGNKSEIRVRIRAGHRVHHGPGRRQHRQGQQVQHDLAQARQQLRRVSVDAFFQCKFLLMLCPGSMARLIEYQSGLHWIIDCFEQS